MYQPAPCTQSPESTLIRLSPLSFVDTTEHASRGYLHAANPAHPSQLNLGITSSRKPSLAPPHFPVILYRNTRFGIHFLVRLSNHHHGFDLRSVDGL